MWTTIDPSTGDYVKTSGSFERSDALTTPIWLRLFSRRGSYIDDDQYGSRLHELYRTKSPETAAKLAPDMVREALQPLVDDGLIATLEVTAEPEISAEDGTTRRGVGIEAAIHDSGDRPYRFHVWQEVGGSASTLTPTPSSAPRS